MLQIWRWLSPCAVALALLLLSTCSFPGDPTTSALQAAIPGSLRVDLVAHFAGHAVLAAALKVFGRLGASAALAVSISFALVLEGVQNTSFAPGRTASMDDLAAATAGSVLGLFVCSALGAVIVREVESSDLIEFRSVALELTQDEHGSTRV
jgi:VanZ family protein